MKLAEIAALADGLAPVIRDLMAAQTAPLLERIAGLETELAAAKAIDHGAAIRAAVAEAVAAIPPAPAGKDGSPGRDGIDGKDGVDGAPGRDGLNGADGKDGAPGERGADGAPGKDGADGKDGAPGADGKDGERGPEGAPGKLQLVKEFAPGVHYESEVVVHKGGTYQALKDTAEEPPHADWICLAAPGRDGKDADEIEVRGTFDATSVYRRLNIVALNGAAFIARKDEPGACPGEGWQMIAMQGKTGRPGEPGKKGDPGVGLKGEPGAAVIELAVSDQGMLTLVNGDGSTVDCDLYPILSKLG